MMTMIMKIIMIIMIIVIVIITITIIIIIIISIIIIIIVITTIIVIIINWWNGKGMLELPQQTSGVDGYQERRGLRQDNLMDTSKNLLCTSKIRINLSQRN